MTIMASIYFCNRIFNPDMDTYQSEPQEWTLTLLHALSIYDACNRVMMLIEKPEENGLAYRIVHLGIITIDEIGHMIDKVSEGMGGEPIEMYEEDILLLYTIVELYVRIMLTETGDEIKERQKKFQEDMPESNRLDMDTIFRSQMESASAFVRKIIEEYEDVPAFAERKELLQQLNDYI